MGRPPSNGGPVFRFNSAEVAEMEAILQANHAVVPAREVLEMLAQKFSSSPERSGKFVVQMKQVWNWFQNRRYAIRAKSAKAPGKLTISPLSQDDSAVANNVPQPPQPQPAPLVRNVPQAPQHLPAPAVHGAGRNGADSTAMEFEAKSARDGAWYDVATFLSHRNLETGDPEVLVRFAGFGAEEDEWVDIRRHVRQRSLPCESSECVAVLPGDLILCFQEGKEQALYFDAHVLDSQRRRHDIRGCRCRFLVRYDHDLSEEIVPLRKVCRRPETDYRLQLLHALNDSATAKQPKAGIEPRTASTLRVYPPAEATELQLKKEEHADVMPATSDTNLSAHIETKDLQPEVSGNVKTGTVANSNGLPCSVQLPETPQIVNAGTLENSNTAPGCFIQQSVVSGIVGNSGTVVQQQEVSQIVNVGNLETSIAPPNSVVQQLEVPEIANIGALENSNVSPRSVVQQPMISEIVNAGSLENSNAPSGSVAQQPEVSGVVTASMLENSSVLDSVAQQPEVSEIVKARTSEDSNSNVPAVGVLEQQEVVQETINPFIHADGNASVENNVAANETATNTNAAGSTENIPPQQ